MASLGFRPPQFSEDPAWLPPWLHHHPYEQLSPDGGSERLTTSSPVVKDLLSSRGLWSDEGGYNSCHLYLSGEDASQLSTSPSAENVLHLHLRLSSDGDSDCNLSQVLCASNALQGSCMASGMQHVETLAHPGGELKQSKIDVDAEAVNFSPPSSVPVALKNVVPELTASNKDKARQSQGNLDHSADGLHSPTLSFVPATGTEDNIDPRFSGSFENCGRKCEEESKFRHVVDTDIYDAIELSIAASETLVIHELIKEGSASNAVSTQAILDIGLQVKKARLEALEDTFSYPLDEMDEIDFLSDLDDLYMKDAFLDVGLSFSASDDNRLQGSDISKVENTPVLKNQCVENSSKALQDKIVDYPGLTFISDMACLVDPDAAGKGPAMETSHVFPTIQPQVKTNIHHACILENTDRFKSRWLGGWKVEEAKALATFNKDCTKSIPQLFVGETSFLSESADVAPDENSFVQRQESRCKTVSQSSISFKGLHDEADKEHLTEEIRSSNISCADSLCSIVPCSISSEDAGSLLPQNDNDKDSDDTDYTGHASEPKGENLQRTSYLNVESGAPVRMKPGLLKNYSTYLLKPDASLEGERLYDSRLLASENGADLLYSTENEGCIRSFNPKNNEGLLPIVFACENISDGENKGKQADAIWNQIAETSNQMSDYDQPTKDESGLHAVPSVSRMSPLILNQRTRHCLQPSELLVNNLNKEKASIQTLEDRNIFNNQRKNLAKIESSTKTFQDAQKPARKRVYFSEVEVVLPGDKCIKTPELTNGNCPPVRVNKRLKHSNSCLGTRSQDVKNHFTGYMTEVGKLIFHGIQFLLTGFSKKREKEIIGQIGKHGGVVLLDIPSPPSFSRKKGMLRYNFQQLPIVLSPKKLQTTKFLYGCAVGAYTLKAKWHSDSIAAGSILPPEKYIIISNQADLRNIRIRKPVCLDERIFYRVGIVLHGNHSFYTKLALIIKHGGGEVFKTLQMLFQSLDAEDISAGFIVAEDWGRAFRHLKVCASERKIPVMSASWIAKSLHSGSLLSVKEKVVNPSTIKESKLTNSLNWSQEI